MSQNQALFWVSRPFEKWPFFSLNDPLRMATGPNVAFQCHSMTNMNMCDNLDVTRTWFLRSRFDLQSMLPRKCLSEIQESKTLFPKTSPISSFTLTMSLTHHQHTPQPQQPSKTDLRNSQYRQTHNTQNFFSLCSRRKWHREIFGRWKQNTFWNFRYDIENSSL